MPFKIAYYTAATMPGIMAHSSQIAHTCQAFIKQDVDLVLCRANRKTVPELATTTTSMHYNLDVEIPEELVPATDFPGLATAHANGGNPLHNWAFKRMVRSYLRNVPDSLAKNFDRIAFSRDIQFHTRAAQTYPDHPRIYEAHSLTQDDEDRIALELQTLKTCRGIAVLTTHMREMLVGRGIPSERIHVAPDAVDPKNFPGALSKTDAREKLSLPLDRPIALYLGRFHTMGLEKGLSTIIEAMPHVLQKHPEVQFLFVGGPLSYVNGYQARLRENSISSGTYRFMDRQPYVDMHIWLAAADILLMPLPNEPRFSKTMSPMKMFEYMTARRPIVASDMPALRDVLRHDINALCPPMGDHYALAIEIMSLLQTPEKAARLADQAVNDVQRHTWDTRARGIIDWMDTLDLTSTSTHQ